MLANNVKNVTRTSSIRHGQQAAAESSAREKNEGHSLARTLFARESASLRLPVFRVWRHHRTAPSQLASSRRRRCAVAVSSRPFIALHHYTHSPYIPVETRGMPVRLRLQRFGRTHSPFYRMVAADSRAPRDGKFLEIVRMIND